jgi:uncharacterized protein (TIGR03083 family)
VTAATAADEQVLAEAITAELAELADIVEALDPSDWDAPSLCAGWRVREVVAHVTMPTRWSVPAVMLGMVRARFRWNVLSDRAARKDAQLSTTQLVTPRPFEFLSVGPPPGGGAQGALVHAVVHGLDITVARGIDRQLPPQRMRLVLDGLLDPKSLRHFGVDLVDTQLRATDLDWSHGSGRLVTKTAHELVLALSGRSSLVA